MHGSREVSEASESILDYQNSPAPLTSRQGDFLNGIAHTLSREAKCSSDSSCCETHCDPVLS